MKHYECMKGGTLLFTWSRPLDSGKDMTAVDLSDPSLRDDVVDINPDADAFTIENDEAEKATLPLTGGARVLVCDDEEALVEFIEKLLREAGYDVRSTLNSLEAIDIAREFQPHVALLGEIMPRMDGFKLAEELTRLLPKTKMVLTSEAEPSDLEMFRVRGWPFDILACPFQVEEVLEKTRIWVRHAGGIPPV